MKSHRHVSGVSVVLCLVMAATQVSANPVGESLRAGRARFDRSGPGALAVHQLTDKLIINWRDFSIAAGETTRFIQPSATSIALNRVTTGNPSRLFGNLEANGKVYLINPNGILVGRGGAVNTRGFVASTLDVSDASFLSSAKLRLSGDSDASVVNEGSIQAIGGDVFLVGRTVENSGSIRGGTVGLGAGSEVMIVPTGRERLSVIAGNPNGGQAEKGVNNEGTIEAVSAELKAAGGNIYALAVNNGGVIRATGVRREGGRVFLSSDGGNIENSGTIVANNANGGGGFISLAGGRNEENPATVINSGTIEARGDAAGTRGGEVRLTGDHVGLFGASLIDVSGHSGGGTALIGGDYQGGNSTVQNAQRTFVDRDSRINADALARGNGGKVIVWSDDATRYYGSLSARGGSGGGDGGFAEVSGKEFLSFHGSADVGAPAGLAGRILLDPRDVTIANAGADDALLADSTLAFAEPDTATDVTISDDVLEALTGNITVQAHRDLMINEALDLANQIAGESVVFEAGGNIDINEAVTTGGASLSFTASHSGGADSPTATLTVDADIGDATTGAISFINDGSGGISFNNPVHSGVSITAVSGGGITVVDNGPNIIDLDADSGTVSLTASTLTLQGEVEGFGGITFTADTIDIQNSVASIDADTAGVLLQPLSNGRLITLSAADVPGTLSLTPTELNKITAGSITIGNATAGQLDISADVSIAAADVNLISGGNIAFGNGDTLTLSTTTGDAVLTAGGAINNAGGGANVVAATLSATAQTGIDLDTTITTLLLADVLGTGGINISDTAGGLAVTAATTADGDITINATGGDLTLTTVTAVGTGADVQLTTTTSGDVIVGAVTALGDSVTVTADGSITDGNVGAVNVTANSLSATAQGGGIDLDTTIATLVLAAAQAAGNIDISDTAGGLNVTAATTTDGSITLIADAGNLAVTTATAGGAGNGINLTTTTSGDIAAGALTATGDAVVLTSAGAITDANVGAVNVTAASLSATAQSGIDLDTDITTLALASVLAAGNINISDASGLVVANANTLNGNITLGATAGILDVTTATAGGAGDIQLTTTTSGNVIVGTVTAVDDTVTINSAGAITDGNGALINILADSLSATADDGINLDTTITTLTLANVLAAGSLNIADSDGLIVTSAAAANGNIDISAAAGALSVASATTTTGGDINLSATGGNLDVTTATAGGSGDVQLTTTTSGDVSVGTVTATGDAVTITSAGAITDANVGAVNVTAASLSATAQSGIDLDTDITTLTLASVLAAGNINISDASGLVVANANTLNGNITLGATAGILDVTTVTAGGAGDIQLTTTTSGNVNLGTVTAAGDAVTIISADGVTDGNAGAVNLVADSVSATADSFGVGNAIETDVNAISVNTSAANGDQFITEANGLTALDLNAGVGEVNLTLTLGALADLDAATDITAGDAILVLNDAALQNVGAAANVIHTSVGTLSVDTTAGNGSQFITEADGLTALNLNAGGGDVTLTLTLGSLLDTDVATDIDAANVTVGVLDEGVSIGSSADPIEIDASGASVLLTALGVGSDAHLEVAQAGNINFFNSTTVGTAGARALFQRDAATTFDVQFAGDLTVRANGNISSTIAAGNFLRVPGALNLVASGSIGGGIANPIAIDAGTLHASAGTGLSFTDVNDVTLGNISSAGGMFFVETANTFTFNNATVINSGPVSPAFLVANGLPGVRVVGPGAPTMSSQFLLYALNSELTDPPVIINQQNKPTIGALIADAIDSPQNFDPTTPDPFGDLLSHFVFSLEANPPTDPSLFIDIPVEVFQPVSIVFGEYDPTKFGEVGDLWMSSSELYEMERKAGKARKALPTQVNQTEYVPEGGK